MPDIQFRPLRPDEWEAFHALRLRSIADMPEAIYPTYEEESSRSPEQVRARITETTHGVVFGAYQDGILVGIAGLRREALVQVAHKGILWGVFVHPERRGGGIARRLLQALFDHARCAGVRQIHLSVNVENPRAAGLYRAMGFETYGREPDAMQVGGRFYDEALMVLRL
ncbi:GNAT family N-acetyltransferase [Massilia sp. BSC265]|uniref:GNAT family N-acetyltransferase n=1 Tax=Massilia sp. BSC265 TaxID=1549812 RepID=UPI0004E92485|nr:GNAT family N-acetyltransferase [Massilia sp. BSC265]KFI08087.1 acetyltransferase [Massilia sp. BSC265]